jgi:hypothetical protein
MIEKGKLREKLYPEKFSGKYRSKILLRGKRA